MPIEGKNALTATPMIDFEAVAALDAALYWAGMDLMRTSLPVESSGLPQAVSHLQKEQHDARSHSRRPVHFPRHHLDG